MRALFAGAVSVLLAALAVGVGSAVAGGKGSKVPKTSPTDGEPWVAGHTLTQWVAFYRTGEAKQKQRAAEMIAWCCTQRQSPDAAKAMIDVLQDEEHRLTACKALAGMHWQGRHAVPALVPCASAKEPSHDTRLAAINALGSIGVTRPGVLEVLVEGVCGNNDEIRRTAGYALYRLGADARPAVPKLMAALKNPEAVVAESAAFALSGIGSPAAEAAPALCVALRHPDFRVRRHSAEALQRMLSDDPAVHKALIAAVKDKGESGAAAVWGLYFCRNVGDDVIDALCWALENGDGSMPYYAALALGERGINSPRTIKPLTAALADKKTRGAAAAALGKRRPVTEATLAALMAAFEKDHYDRIAIANALAEMGPAAESTAKRLKEALSERKAVGWSYEMVHVALADALWQIGKDRDMIPLLGKLGCFPNDQNVYGRALEALGSMGPDAKAAVPELVKALDIPGGNWVVARALVKIGVPEGEAALKKIMASKDAAKRLNAAYALWELKKDPAALAMIADTARSNPDFTARRRAVMALGEAPADDEVAMLRLTTALDDECVSVQRDAAKAIARFGAEARPAVRPLARLLASDSWSVADQAARTLGAIGPAASKALPELRKAAEDSMLRAQAMAAIKRIER